MNRILRSPLSYNQKTEWCFLMWWRYATLNYNIIDYVGFITLVSPSLFSSMISNSKSDLWPLWSNFIFPVSPFISIWTKQVRSIWRVNRSQVSVLTTDHLHEIDETVAVLPRVLPVTAQRANVDVLREIQLVESLGEQPNCVVDKSRLRLDKKFALKQI